MTLDETSKKSVVLAPLVLLSACDHYIRSARGSKRRVVGVLLGQNNGTRLRVANSFAVPFEEDERDPAVWFLDQNYIESMNDMFKKINAKEKLIGWYHSGPRLRQSDLAINELFKDFCPDPALVIIDVESNNLGIPTDAYTAVEEIKDDGTTTARSFVHIPSTIEAEEAEEIGVEHLLRDVRDAAVGSLSTKITSQLHALLGLKDRLQSIADYLGSLTVDQNAVNHSILNLLQDVFNLLPNISSSKEFSQHGAVDDNLLKAFSSNTNDQMMCVYLSSLIRAIVAFHDLVENKLQNGERRAELNIEDKPGLVRAAEKREQRE